MLIKRTERQARRGMPCRRIANSVGWRPRPPHLPAPLRSRRRQPRDTRRAAARLGAQGRGRTATARRRQSHHPQEHLHALRRRLHGNGGSRERRLDRPGAELGQPHQPRLALRQGRIRARTGERRTSVEISDEAGQRPMDPRVLGSGDRRDRRQDDGDPRAVGTGFGLLGSAPPR